MKRIFSILFAVVLVVSFSLIPAAPAMAQPNEVWVDDDFTSATPSWGTTHFDKIQDGIDAVASGGTVNVAAGTYAESVVISTDDITLKGEVGAIMDGTTLAGAGSVHGITLTAGLSGVTIEGLTIRNYRGNGGSNDRSSAIQAWNDGTNDITIENNIMHDNFWNAILVGNAGTGLHENWGIKDNEVYDNGYVGIELTNAHDSVIEGNEVDGGVYGIVIQARNTIPESGAFDPTDIQVQDNEVSGAYVGIYVIALASEPLEPWGDIEDAYTELGGVVLADNEVRDNTGFGIYIYSYGGGLVVWTAIQANEVRDNGASHGIVLYGVEDSEVSENEVSGSGMDGIALYGGASNNEVEENEVSGSGRYGISLRGGASNNEVKENEVKDSETCDLHWDSSGSGNTWVDNEYETSNLP